MDERALRGCRVLVVEDEYLLAEELQRDLRDAGAIVVGPVGRLDAAIELARSDEAIDIALLDVNLGGEDVFQAADLLAGRGVELVFTTGYDAASIPARYAGVTTCEKPVAIPAVLSLLAGLAARTPRSSG